MHPLRSTLAFVVLPVALAAAPWSSDLGFHPPDDSKVTREYSIQFDFELGDLTMIADGQDMSEMVPGDFEVTGELRLQVDDHFVRSGGGRALELIRTYAEIVANMEAAGESQDFEGADKLEGKTVRFLWNEDESDYDVAFHESEGDESALQAISADMDLSVLLPGKAVEVGDVWTVPAEEIGSVLMFGGDLDDQESGDEMGALMKRELGPQFDAMLADFKISCEYRGEREEGGVRVGVIGLTLAGEGELDLEPVILAAMEVQELPMEIDLSFNSALLEMSFEGKGELLWNLKNGMLHAFDMGADMEFAADINVAMDAGGESHEMQAEVEVLGRGTWKVRTPGGD
ncbi:MAG TPA: hypothetical protein VMT18_12030 [Planctomycetota bacterium]|nr:hypothetical protein [Planctomycetota bacterium]